MSSFPALAVELAVGTLGHVAMIWAVFFAYSLAIGRVLSLTEALRTPASLPADWSLLVRYALIKAKW